MEQSPGPQRNLPVGKIFLVLSLVLLIVVGSVMLVYTTVTNQQATDHAHATATAQTNTTSDAQSATNTAIGELQATETAQVSAMLTASANATATATQMAKGQATANAIANSTTSSQVPQTPSNQNPYPPYRGTLALNDPLIDNSQGHNWEEYARPNMYNCQFVNGALESSLSNGYREEENICVAKNTDFNNFVFQVQMTLLKGYCGGISFRGDTNIGFLYEFHVCANGIYEFYSIGGNYMGSPLAYGPVPFLHKGIGQTYILAVVAIASTMTFYANYQKIATVSQSYGPHGQIGCVATSLGSALTVAIFRNAKVWVL